MADLTNIPIGVGIAVLVVREASRFLKEQKNGGGIGTKSAEFLKGEMRDAVFTEIDRHLLPGMVKMLDLLNDININIRELRWRDQNRRSDNT